MYCEDSGREYFYREEVSSGFLRPSLEETLASKRLTSVRGRGGGGSKVLLDTVFFLFFLSYFSFAFLFFCHRTFLALFCRDSGASLTLISFVAVSPCWYMESQNQDGDFLR